MYGRGNYAPQFGQGLQRPMPPYQQQQQQQLAGHPVPTNFQPGNSVPIQSVVQPGGPPHGRGPAYFHAPPAPWNMSQQGPPVSTSNTSHPYLHPSRPPFLGAQPNFVPGSQNSQSLPPPPPSIGQRAPPPPPFMQLPPPPLPSAGKQQSTGTQMSAVAPQPPLPPSSPPMAPPPPSTSSQTQPGHVSVSGNVVLSNDTTHSQKNGDNLSSDEDMSLKQSVAVDLPPPPPKPADENAVRNIEVLCQFIAKNGPEFEEMARKNEYGNPDFNFFVGGDPGSEAACAHEYFVWMKNKCNIENGLHKDQGKRETSQREVDVKPSSGPNSLPNLGTAHSPADSDVDMEDDITQSDKEHGAYITEDVKQEPVLAGDASAMQKQENNNELQHLKENSPALKSSQCVKLEAGAESKPESPAGEPVNAHSPFRLIQNYASDDSSDDDGEQCHENVKATSVSPTGEFGALNSHDAAENAKKNSEIGVTQSVTTCLESGLTKDRVDLQAIKGDLLEAPDNTLQGKYENDDLDGTSEGLNAKIASHGKYVSGSSDVYSAATHKDVKKDDYKNSRSALKVDEFGRLVKEGASESESDESHHLRRRGRRDRSRSRSRSPSDRRRRRSPRRRKERRSRSRSWSPKRRRSRSRSPYRPGGDSHGDKLRRGKVQCFDFLKGRCYRGASCRYMHHEVDKDEHSRRYNSKQHHVADKHDSRSLVTHARDDRSIAEAIDDAAWPSASHRDFDKLSTDVITVVDSRKGVQVSDTSDEPKPHPPISEDQLLAGVPSTNEHEMNPSEVEGSFGTHHKVDKDLLKKDNSSQIDCSIVQTSTISPSGLSANDPCLDKTSSEFTTPNASVPDFSLQASHLPPPPLPHQASNASQNPNVLVNYNYMPPSGSLPPQSVPVGSGPLYQAPIPNQQSLYPPFASTAWNVPSQPRPPHMVVPSMPGNPLQHGNFPLRNDFPGQMSLRPHPGELPSQSHVGGFSHQTYHLPSVNIPAQPFAGSNLARDDRYPQFLTQSSVPSSSFVPGGVPQPVPFQGDSTVKGTQSTPGFSSNLGDRDNSSSFFDVGGTKISAHYNPYASTFDQPLSTRFSSIAFSQGREAATGVQYNNPFGVGPSPMDGQLSDDPTSRQIISSSNSSKAGGQTVLKSGGDQYDPLSDSIDLKLAQKQDHAADNSDIMLKLSNHHNVLDVEENNRQKMVGSVAASASLENDEFGETADAEVGAVENASPSDPNEDANIAEGDIEIDQVKPEGRSKKSKDSRSMKMFKVAVANFVKDVLKPQWRQGNMSKEVFKTIVKKTVDKVSGAMKNHRLPKSQAKIDHYIDSSRRKLTQLVEGYVSKYKS